MVFQNVHIAGGSRDWNENAARLWPVASNMAIRQSSWKNVKGNTWRFDLQQMRFYCHILQQLIRLAAVAAQTRKRARADSRDHYRNNWPLALSHAIVWNLSSRLQEPLILWNLTGLKHLVILLAVPVALFILSYACLWLLKSKCSWLHVLQILLMFADVSDMYTKLYE